MKINKYPDGSSYVESHNPDLESFDTIEYTFRVNSYEDLWHLNQWVDAYNTNHLGVPPSILIPNLIDAQADRRFGVNQSSGLKLVCEFLNRMNANFKIFHPHNPEIVEALIDNVEIIDNSHFINRVLDIYADGRCEHSLEEENLILMSSDAGSFKPLMKLCDKIDWRGSTYSASKYRSYVDGKSELTQIINKKNFHNKDILIIDDISVYGGTFKGLSKLLRSKNCGKLYLAVSHMTVQNLGENPVTDYFNKVFVTNSKFDKCYFIDEDKHIPENLEIIKLF